MSPFAKLACGSDMPPPSGRWLMEVDGYGQRTVLALSNHYRDTLGSIHGEAQLAFKLWPEIECVVAVGGEYHGYYMPRSLWAKS